MEGLRDVFFKVDSHCALDVGHLNGDKRSSDVRRPKFEEGCPGASIREGPEELTLRAEEVGPRKRASISVTLQETGGDRLGRRGLAISQRRMARTVSCSFSF